VGDIMHKLMVIAVFLVLLLVIASSVIGFMVYKQKEIQTLYLFLEDTENIEEASSSIKGNYVNERNVFPGILDGGYPTEQRIKLSDMMLNHQKKYTKEKLLAIFETIGVQQKDADKSILDYQSIIDFHLSVMVAMRDRKNDELISLMKRYYQQDSGLGYRDNISYIILLAKEKLASTVGVNWRSWASL
jgi:hypothetical protein